MNPDQTAPMGEVTSLRDFFKIWSNRQTLAGNWQNYCFMVKPNGPIFKVAGTEGQVGGSFCRLPALNENTESDLGPYCL